jgi:hypothetical protein
MTLDFLYMIFRPSTSHPRPSRRNPETELGPVYMEAGLARLARQPGKRDLVV